MGTLRRTIYTTNHFISCKHRTYIFIIIERKVAILDFVQNGSVKQFLQSDDELDTSLVLILFLGIEVWLVLTVSGESSGIKSASISSK